MSEIFDEVRRRCEAAGLEIDPHPPYYLMVIVPRGSGEHAVEIDSEKLQWASSVPFEDYEMLEGFEASWSSKHQIIECSFGLDRDTQNRHWFLGMGSDKSLAPWVLKALDPLFDDEAPLTSQRRVRFESSTELSISIGPMSEVHALLVGVFPPTNNVNYLTLQIEGTSAATHDSAVDLLEQVANSLFFGIDSARNMTFELEPYLELPELGSDSERKESGPLPSVDLRYDRETMALYWSAQAVSNNPLLQFLAYYQVLEYYFKDYSWKKVERTVRDILREPGFRPRNDADTNRLLKAIKGTYGIKRSVEESHLTTTIEWCVTPEELRAFLIGEDDNRYEFYMSDVPKSLSRYLIPIREATYDLREYVARRVYDIRCRIVHTKADFGENPLFPNDPETKDLHHDIDLVRFLARKVLEASSHPF